MATVPTSTAAGSLVHRRSPSLPQALPPPPPCRVHIHNASCYNCLHHVNAYGSLHPRAGQNLSEMRSRALLMRVTPLRALITTMISQITPVSLALFSLNPRLICTFISLADSWEGPHNLHVPQVYLIRQPLLRIPNGFHQEGIIILG